MGVVWREQKKKPRTEKVLVRGYCVGSGSSNELSSWEDIVVAQTATGVFSFETIKMHQPRL